MSSEWIELTVEGSPMPVYVAYPEGRPRGAVIVIQEIFGVNDDMQRLTDLVASAGYLGVAPAIYHRTDPHFDAAHDEAGFAKGFAAAQATTLAGIAADLGATASWIRTKLGAGTKIATWGFCYGGAVAFYSATLDGIDAALPFYGGQIAKPFWQGEAALVDRSSQLRAPLLLAFGGDDPYISADDQAAIRAALERTHARHEIAFYPSEGHGFFRKGPGASESAAGVWERVRRFLAANLG